MQMDIPKETTSKADARAKAAEQKAAAKRDLSRRDNPLPEDRGPITDEVPAPRSSTEAPATTSAQSSTPNLAAESPQASRGAASAKVPLHDGAALMDLAFDGLTPGQRSAFIQQYFKRSTGVGAVVADLRADLERPARASLAEILQQVAAGLLEES
ncbi:hypothetical protein ACH414_33080 [Streptomyces sp. NPDC020422]|uniref:hypothetical protein n=1 Tax=Streptomyces sp. NPDC020422 TaxID=3365074 RepID=UPI0037B0E4DA